MGAGRGPNVKRSFFIFCSNGGKQQTPPSFFVGSRNSNIQDTDGNATTYRQFTDDDKIDGDIL